ncbi:MAG: tetratricopeptide repeat protein [Lentisphaerae bacterium]|nr:tetratricopeptide repeat protein [Lentisphaerota bacterium]
MRFFQRGCIRSVSFFVVALFVFCGTANGQKAPNFDTMSVTEIYEYARQMLERRDYARAVEPLQAVIDELKALTGDNEKQTTQECRLELARVYYQLGQTDEGVALVEEYMENDPRPNERLALRMMAQAFFETEDWDKIIEYASRIRSDPEMTPDDEYNMNLLIGQAYFLKEMWEESIDPLLYAERNADDDRVRQKCQIMVARALVETENWSNLFAWVRRVESSDCRYDITLNITMMLGAEGLYASGGKDNLLNALYLYRMVLPREELISFSEKKKAELQRKINGVELQPFEIKEYEREVENLDASIEQLNNMDPYEDHVDLSIGEIYASEEIKRYWEGYVAFKRVFDRCYIPADEREEFDEEEDEAAEAKELKIKIGEAGGYYAAAALYNLNEFDRAEQRIMDYLNEWNNAGREGMFQREYLLLMIGNNLNRSNFGAVISLRKYIEGLEISAADPNKRMAKANLYYMLGLAYLQTQQNAEACEQFGVFVDGLCDESGYVVEDFDFPNRSYALYYRGMGYMLQGKFAEALSDFEQYLDEYEEGDLVDEAIFRKGVCQYALSETVEDTKGAEETFTYLIDNYEQSSVRSEAYSMRGDIRVAKEPTEKGPHPLDLAQEDYDAAIKTSNTPLQALYPAKRSAEAYQLESKWDEIIARMEQYKAKWGVQADLAEAQYWIGQAYLRQDEVEKAFNAYMGAIADYGNFPGQLGVDKIIMEMVGLVESQKDASTRNSWIQLVRLKLDDARSANMEVLALRWQLTRALLQGEESLKSFSDLLVSTVNDLTVTSPGPLYLMCDAAVEAGDLEKMTNYANYFISNFEESDLVWHAYRARVTAQMELKQYEDVLVSVGAVQNLFGPVPEVGWSQISKANALDQLGRSQEAEEAFKTISSVPQWRNEYMGEAYCGIGRTLFQQGEFAQALGWYKRTYMQCKAYDNGIWAAMAYLGAADCLVEQGESAQAQSILQEMMADQYLNSEERAPFIAEYIQKAEQRLQK